MVSSYNSQHTTLFDTHAAEKYILNPNASPEFSAVVYVELVYFALSCANACFVQCTETCPTVMADGWFSALMVCNIKPRNATLMWTQDENTANASYIVLYEDGIGNQLRSAVVSVRKCSWFFCISFAILYVS